MNRKLWSSEEKVAIVLEILRGDELAVVVSFYLTVGLRMKALQANFLKV